MYDQCGMLIVVGLASKASYTTGVPKLIGAMMLMNEPE